MNRNATINQRLKIALNMAPMELDCNVEDAIYT